MDRVPTGKTLFRVTFCSDDVNKLAQFIYELGQVWTRDDECDHRKDQSETIFEFTVSSLFVERIQKTLTDPSFTNKFSIISCGTVDLTDPSKTVFNPF